MKKTSSAAAFAFAAVLAACSSSSSTPSPSPAPTDTSTGSSGGASDTPPSATPPAAAAPKAPAITEVMKMQGALHVSWTNNEPSADSVEVERQATMSDGTIMEKYKMMFSVPGDADNKMDSSATDNMTYTYRLRAKKGTTYSAYSNEMSANPTK